MLVSTARHEEIGFRDKLWETHEVVRFAKCEPATLLSWRRKYGFLGGPESGRGRVGYKHSFIDIVLARTAVIMIKHGLDPADACSVPLLEAGVQLLAAGDSKSPLLAFHRGGKEPDIRASFYFARSNQRLSEFIENAPDRIVTVLDLRSIVDLALNELGLVLGRAKSGRKNSRDLKSHQPVSEQASYSEK